MRPRRSIAVPLAGGLAAVTLLTSVAVLVALRNGGEARIGPVVAMRIAAGYDRRANGLVYDRLPTTRDMAAAADLSKRAIGQYPEDLSAWVRLVYVDYLQHGALTAQGLADLRRSYDLIGVDPQFGLARIRLALLDPQPLPSELLEEVHAEVAVLGRSPRWRPRLEALARDLSTPAGRETLNLWLTRLGPAVAQ
jgi:hypothetical protein